jgi:hypothetical protein
MPSGPHISTEEGEDGANLGQLLADFLRDVDQGVGVPTTKFIHVIQNGKSWTEKHHTPRYVSDNNFKHAAGAFLTS